MGVDHRLQSIPHLQIHKNNIGTDKSIYPDQTEVCGLGFALISQVGLNLLGLVCGVLFLNQNFDCINIIVIYIKYRLYIHDP